MFVRWAAVLASVAASLPTGRAHASRFAVYGDTRDNPAVHARVVAQIAGAHVDLALFTGDAAMHGDSVAEWAAFAQVEAPLADAGLPIYAVRGNHDTGPLFLKHFTPLPAGTTGTPTYYAFDALGLHFLGLDTEGDDAPGSAQYQFVKADLEAHTGHGPIVVFLHRALYSSGHHGDDARLDEVYAPLFKAARVVAVFQGHDHDYERSKPIDGVTYFVEGGGGATQRAFEGPAPAWSAVRAQVYGYMLVDVLAAELKLQAFDENGLVVDSISLPFPASTGAPGPTPAPTVTAPPLPPVVRAAPPPATAPTAPPSSSDELSLGAMVALSAVTAAAVAFFLWRRKP